MDINECLATPCQNGAICVNRVGTYECICIKGYEGNNCSNEIDECSESPCANGAVCNDKIGTYECDCTAGFTGTNCSEEIDECDSTPCFNNGTCIDKFDGFSCVCYGGFYGDLCDLAIIRESVTDDVDNDVSTESANNIDLLTDEIDLDQTTVFGKKTTSGLNDIRGNATRIHERLVDENGIASSNDGMESEAFEVSNEFTAFLNRSGEEKTTDYETFIVENTTGVFTNGDIVFGGKEDFEKFVTIVGNQWEKDRGSGDIKSSGTNLVVTSESFTLNADFSMGSGQFLFSTDIKSDEFGSMNFSSGNASDIVDIVSSGDIVDDITMGSDKIVSSGGVIEIISGDISASGDITEQMEIGSGDIFSSTETNKQMKSGSGYIVSMVDIIDRNTSSFDGIVSSGDIIEHKENGSGDMVSSEYMIEHKEIGSGDMVSSGDMEIESGDIVSSVGIIEHTEIGSGDNVSSGDIIEHKELDSGDIVPSGDIIEHKEIGSGDMVSSEDIIEHQEIGSGDMVSSENINEHQEIGSGDMVSSGDMEIVSGDIVSSVGIIEHKEIGSGDIVLSEDIIEHKEIGSGDIVSSGDVIEHKEIGSGDIVSSASIIEPEEIGSGDMVSSGDIIEHKKIGSGDMFSSGDIIENKEIRHDDNVSSGDMDIGSGDIVSSGAIIEHREIGSGDMVSSGDIIEHKEIGSVDMVSSGDIMEHMVIGSGDIVSSGAIIEHKEIGSGDMVSSEDINEHTDIGSGDMVSSGDMGIKSGDIVSSGDIIEHKEIGLGDMVSSGYIMEHKEIGSGKIVSSGDNIEHKKIGSGDMVSSGDIIEHKEIGSDDIVSRGDMEIGSGDIVSSGGIIEQREIGSGDMVFSGDIIEHKEMGSVDMVLSVDIMEHKGKGSGDIVSSGDIIEHMDIGSRDIVSNGDIIEHREMESGDMVSIVDIIEHKGIGSGDIVSSGDIIEHIETGSGDIDSSGDMFEHKNFGYGDIVSNEDIIEHKELESGDIVFREDILKHKNISSADIDSSRYVFDDREIKSGDIVSNKDIFNDKDIGSGDIVSRADTTGVKEIGSGENIDVRYTGSGEVVSNESFSDSNNTDMEYRIYSGDIKESTAISSIIVSSGDRGYVEAGDSIREKQYVGLFASGVTLSKQGSTYGDIISSGDMDFSSKQEYGDIIGKHDPIPISKEELIHREITAVSVTNGENDTKGDIIPSSEHILTTVTVSRYEVTTSDLKVTYDNDKISSGELGFGESIFSDDISGRTETRDASVSYINDISNSTHRYDNKTISLGNEFGSGDAIFKADLTDNESTTRSVEFTANTSYDTINTYVPDEMSSSGEDETTRIVGQMVTESLADRFSTVFTTNSWDEQINISKDKSSTGKTSTQYWEITSEEIEVDKTGEKVQYSEFNLIDDDDEIEYINVTAPVQKTSTQTTVEINSSTPYFLKDGQNVTHRSSQHTSTSISMSEKLAEEWISNRETPSILSTTHITDGTSSSPTIVQSVNTSIELSLQKVPTTISTSIMSKEKEITRSSLKMETDSPLYTKLAHGTERRTDSVPTTVGSTHTVFYVESESSTGAFDLYTDEPDITDDKEEHDASNLNSALTARKHLEGKNEQMYKPRDKKKEMPHNPWMAARMHLRKAKQYSSKITSTTYRITPLEESESIPNKNRTFEMSTEHVHHSRPIASDVSSTPSNDETHNEIGVLLVNSSTPASEMHPLSMYEGSTTISKALESGTSSISKVTYLDILITKVDDFSDKESEAGTLIDFTTQRHVFDFESGLTETTTQVTMASADDFVDNTSTTLDSFITADTKHTHESTDDRHIPFTEQTPSINETFTHVGMHSDIISSSLNRTSETSESDVYLAEPISPTDIKGLSFAKQHNFTQSFTKLHLFETNIPTSSERSEENLAQSNISVSLHLTTLQADPLGQTQTTLPLQMANISFDSNGTVFLVSHLTIGAIDESLHQTISSTDKHNMTLFQITSTAESSVQNTEATLKTDITETTVSRQDTIGQFPSNSLDVSIVKPFSTIQQTKKDTIQFTTDAVFSQTELQTKPTSQENILIDASNTDAVAFKSNTSTFLYTDLTSTMQDLYDVTTDSEHINRLEQTTQPYTHKTSKSFFHRTTKNQSGSKGISSLTTPGTISPAEITHETEDNQERTDTMSIKQTKEFPQTTKSVSGDKVTHSRTDRISMNETGITSSKGMDKSSEYTEKTISPHSHVDQIVHDVQTSTNSSDILPLNTAQTPQVDAAYLTNENVSPLAEAGVTEYNINDTSSSSYTTRSPSFMSQSSKTKIEIYTEGNNFTESLDGLLNLSDKTLKGDGHTTHVKAIVYGEMTTEQLAQFTSEEDPDIIHSTNVSFTSITVDPATVRVLDNSTSTVIPPKASHTYFQTSSIPGPVVTEETATIHITTTKSPYVNQTTENVILDVETPMSTLISTQPFLQTSQRISSGEDDMYSDNEFTINPINQYFDNTEWFNIIDVSHQTIEPRLEPKFDVSIDIGAIDESLHQTISSTDKHNMTLFQMTSTAESSVQNTEATLKTDITETTVSRQDTIGQFPSNSLDVSIVKPFSTIQQTKKDNIQFTTDAVFSQTELQTKPTSQENILIDASITDAVAVKLKTSTFLYTDLTSTMQDLYDVTTDSEHINRLEQTNQPYTHKTSKSFFHRTTNNQSGRQGISSLTTLGTISPAEITHQTEDNQERTDTMSIKQTKEFPQTTKFVSGDKVTHSRTDRISMNETGITSSKGMDKSSEYTEQTISPHSHVGHIVHDVQTSTNSSDILPLNTSQTPQVDAAYLTNENVSSLAEAGVTEYNANDTSPNSYTTRSPSSRSQSSKTNIEIYTEGNNFTESLDGLLNLSDKTLKSDGQTTHVKVIVYGEMTTEQLAQFTSEEDPDIIHSTNVSFTSITVDPATVRVLDNSTSTVIPPKASHTYFQTSSIPGPVVTEETATIHITTTKSPYVKQTTENVILDVETSMSTLISTQQFLQTSQRISSGGDDTYIDNGFTINPINQYFDNTEWFNIIDTTQEMKRSTQSEEQTTETVTRVKSETVTESSILPIISSVAPDVSGAVLQTTDVVDLSSPKAYVTKLNIIASTSYQNERLETDITSTHDGSTEEAKTQVPLLIHVLFNRVTPTELPTKVTTTTSTDWSEIQSHYDSQHTSVSTTHVAKVRYEVDLTSNNTYPFPHKETYEYSHNTSLANGPAKLTLAKIRVTVYRSYEYSKKVVLQTYQRVKDISTSVTVTAFQNSRELLQTALKRVEALWSYCKTGVDHYIVKPLLNAQVYIKERFNNAYAQLTRLFERGKTIIEQTVDNVNEETNAYYDSLANYYTGVYRQYSTELWNIFESLKIPE
ncbi:hypothetical protein DPMN_001401 [Dreissena polymorpha]|uniref:EGF-like domain-containing protein n=2 Tax=Dreissena polymorpha TaxID=45954 RepID=A0A9D4RST4_DREPO|nr:hypothetical protein DPMN_001401 [Dreissena polymorpha]